MNADRIKEILQSQQKYFQSGATLPVSFRRETLKRLYAAVRAHEDEIGEALKHDLGKSDYESFMCEIGLALSEISYMIKHVGSFARERRVRTPLSQFAAKSYEKPTPYGNVLIMSPWNYPFLLTVDPLANAIAAGNTAIVKPSAYSPATGEVIAKIIGEVFPENYVAAVTGGRQENSELLEQKFDFVFFTGSGSVGREVLRHTAKTLTPAVLELGGKSPCIVDDSADIVLAAKRIIWGKFLNCGQTCVAPDYILCDKSVKDGLIEELKKQIVTQFGENPLDNPDYGRIVNQKHFERICSLVDESKVVVGGETDAQNLKIAPTVMDNVDWNDAVMGEEIFGPVLPVLTYEKFDDVFGTLLSREKPLALYIFSTDKKRIKEITERIPYGGGCVNDVIIHLATSEMGFGGVGESGMGAYHGKRGFETFSHIKSIVDKKLWIDLPMRYQPFDEKKYKKLLRRFLK